MDNSRITSPPSTHVYDLNPQHGTHIPTSRPLMHASRSSATSSGPMPIPNVKFVPPPPLPPPRNPGVAAGSDLALQWANNVHHHGSGGTGSVVAGSSLLGGYNRGMKQEDSGHDGPGSFRRGSSSLTIQSDMLPDTQAKYDRFRNQDEGYHSLSGSSLTNQILHGGEALAQRNQARAQRDIEDSSLEYDKQLLSKIGKPITPPRLSTLGGGDASPGLKKGFALGGKYPPQQQADSGSEGMSSFVDPSFRADSPFSSTWENSARSAVLSPGRPPLAGSGRCFMDYRSPTFESSAASSAMGSSAVGSSAIGSERYAHVHGHGGQNRRSGSASSVSASVLGVNSDEASLPSSAASAGSGSSLAGLSRPSRVSRSKRGSYDQALLAEAASDFPMEETGRMRQLRLDDRPPPPSTSTTASATASPRNRDLYSPDLRLGGGMKRKPSSELRDAAHDDKASLHSLGNGSEPRRTAHLSANLAATLHPSHSSISSTSSAGLRNGSYASSAALSYAGSSITSVSSHDRLSPTGISPSAEQYDSRDSPYGTPASLNPSPRAKLSRPHQRTASVDTKSSAAAIARKMSSDNSGQLRINNSNNASELQGVYMCECCPKKPKKFNNLQDKKNHEMEKQYSCNYCQNRFKNKNEAERHQNSLHLRRHSWSCATLQGNINAAFHPSTAIPTSANNSSNSQPPPPTGPAASDICGYCGEDFPNYPSPDWAARRSHVINVHKFGECNQSKKFFRADHFRQHLKHSHAGTSGKWTNMLETSCMKEESLPQDPSFPPGPMGGAPVANMSMPSSARAALSAAVFGGMGGGLKEERIDEMRDEV